MIRNISLEKLVKNHIKFLMLPIYKMISISIYSIGQIIIRLLLHLILHSLYGLGVLH